jgi:hypothetical protein
MARTAWIDILNKKTKRNKAMGLRALMKNIKALQNGKSMK